MWGRRRLAFIKVRGDGCLCHSALRCVCVCAALARWQMVMAKSQGNHLDAQRCGIVLGAWLPSSVAAVSTSTAAASLTATSVATSSLALATPSLAHTAPATSAAPAAATVAHAFASSAAAACASARVP